MGLCLSEAGTVLRVRREVSTGYAAYDRKILSRMLGWRYNPYLVNGRPHRVCTTITFLYVPG